MDSDDEEDGIEEIKFMPRHFSFSFSKMSHSPVDSPSQLSLTSSHETKDIQVDEIFWYIPQPIISVGGGDSLFVPTMSGIELSESPFAYQMFLYRGEQIAIKLPVGKDAHVVEHLSGPMTGYEFLNYIHHFYIINKRVIDQDYWNNHLLFSKIITDGDYLRLITSPLV